MQQSIPQPTADAAFLGSLAHTRYQACYQCGKCTAGCPLAAQMDVVPNQLIRLLQIGHTDRAARADSIWQCVACETCTARCPKSVDCAGIMDALRQFSFERNLVSQARQRTVLFQRAFLQNVRRNGRLNELELIASFKTAAFLNDRKFRLLFKDAALAPELAKRRKLHWTGEKSRDRAVVGRIFARCMGGSLK